MTDQSLFAPSKPASIDFQEFVDKLRSVAVAINDCKWVANALHLSVSPANDSTPHETSKRMQGVSRVLFTTLRKANNDILNLVDFLESRKGSES